LPLAEEVAADCGRPVLVVPAAIGAAKLHRALLAWDGSREAVRAFHDALPLLRQAGAAVEIAAIEGHEAALDLAPLLEHMRRHRIAVEGEVPLPASGSAARLVERLKEGHFDLLIMGACAHPVWLEFLFGGATPSALMNASTPVLISR
jgi:nucleotide-binding universal stress UspA family protein